MPLIMTDGGLSSAMSVAVNSTLAPVCTINDRADTFLLIGFIHCTLAGFLMLLYITLFPGLHSHMSQRFKGSDNEVNSSTLKGSVDDPDVSLDTAGGMSHSSILFRSRKGCKGQNQQMLARKLKLVMLENKVPRNRRQRIRLREKLLVAAQGCHLRTEKHKSQCLPAFNIDQCSDYVFSRTVGGIGHFNRNRAASHAEYEKAGLFSCLEIYFELLLAIFRLMATALLAMFPPPSRPKRFRSALIPKLPGYSRTVKRRPTKCIEFWVVAEWSMEVAPEAARFICCCLLLCAVGLVAVDSTLPSSHALPIHGCWESPSLDAMMPMDSISNIHLPVYAVPERPRFRCWVLVLLTLFPALASLLVFSCNHAWNPRFYCKRVGAQWWTARMSYHGISSAVNWLDFMSLNKCLLFLSMCVIQCKATDIPSWYTSPAVSMAASSSVVSWFLGRISLESYYLTVLSGAFVVLCIFVLGIVSASLFTIDRIKAGKRTGRDGEVALLTTACQTTFDYQGDVTNRQMPVSSLLVNVDGHVQSQTEVSSPDSSDLWSDQEADMKDLEGISDQEEEEEKFDTNHSIYSLLPPNPVGKFMTPKKGSIYGNSKTARSTRSLYGKRFWSSYEDAGGQDNSHKYCPESINVPWRERHVWKSGHRLPDRLTEWCLSMQSTHYPRCQNCTQPVGPQVSAKPSSRGCVYYSCSVCNKSFRWGSTLWAYMYRNSPHFVSDIIVAARASYAGDSAELDERRQPERTFYRRPRAGPLVKGALFVLSLFTCVGEVQGSRCVPFQSSRVFADASSSSQPRIVFAWSLILLLGLLVLFRKSLDRIGSALIQCMSVCEIKIPGWSESLLIRYANYLTHYLDQSPEFRSSFYRLISVLIACPLILILTPSTRALKLTSVLLPVFWMLVMLGGIIYLLARCGKLTIHSLLLGSIAVPSVCLVHPNFTVGSMEDSVSLSSLPGPETVIPAPVQYWDTDGAVDATTSPGRSHGFPHDFEVPHLDLPHCHLGAIKVEGASIDNAIPDTGSNFNIVPNISYLFDIVFQGSYPVEGVSTAEAKAMGSVRISQLDVSNEMVTQDLKQTLVISTCNSVLIGNKNPNLKFDSWNSNLKHLRNGDRSSIIAELPVKFENDSYSIPTYVHKPGHTDSDADILRWLRLAHGLPASPPTWNTSSGSKGSVDESATGSASPEIDRTSRNLSIVDLCCGIGCVSEQAHTMGHSVLAAADIDVTALQQYSHRNSSDVPLFGDLIAAVEDDGSDALCTITHDADVCFVGPPCNNFTNLNMFAAKPDSDSKLFAAIAKYLDKSKCKIMVLENVSGLLTAQGGHFHGDFVQLCADHGYTVSSSLENSRDVLSSQSRERLWTYIVRLDVEEQCGPFLRSLPNPNAPALTLNDCLDPVKNLVIREDLRDFGVLDQPVINNNGTVIIANTGKRGPRNAAYCTDHGCPTITSGDCTVWDQRLGLYRKLNLTEKSAVLGHTNYTFDDFVPIGRRAGLLGRSMDRHVISSILLDLESYLSSFNSCLSVVDRAHSCLASDMLHEAFGHAGKELSAAMGIPHPKQCDFCDQGNRKKAGTSCGVKSRNANFGQVCHVDFKISSNPDYNDCTVLMGATCDGTNWQETYPMVKRSEVQQVMRRLKADIRDLGGKMQTIITDNDSVLTSRDFQDFLVEDPTQLLTMQLCPPHHHEYSGRQESRWRLRKSIATKAMAQLALVIGDDALKFWCDAYVFAGDVMNRRKFKRHGTDHFEVSPYEQVHGREPSMDKFFPFGAIVTVHDHNSEPHQLTGRKGVCLGKSRQHHEEVQKVFMLDTRRVIRTIDVSLTDSVAQPVLDYDDWMALEDKTETANFSLPVDELLLESVTTTVKASDSGLANIMDVAHPDQKIISTIRRPKLNQLSGTRFLLDRPAVTAKHDSTQSVSTTVSAKPASKYTGKSLKHLPKHRIVINTPGLDRCNTQYIVDRCNIVSGMQIQNAIGTFVQDKDGQTVKYKAGDLAYDLNASRFDLHAPMDDIQSFLAESNTSWLKELPASTSEPHMFDHNGTMPDSLFSQAAQSFLVYSSDYGVTPLGSEEQHSLEVEWWDGTTEYFDFVRDLTPHAFAVGPISALDKPPRNIRDIHRLDDKPKEMYLKSLEKEYNGLWNRGLFKLRKRHVARDLNRPVFDTTTVLRMKFLQNGQPDVAKARVCLRGDLMKPGRDYGEVHSPTCLMDSVKLLIADCPIKKKIAVTYDVQQAFTYGKVDPSRRTFIKQFPGTEKILDPQTGEELIMELLFRLYGDPAAPRAFHKELHGAYMDFQYKSKDGTTCRWRQSKADCCVYYMNLTDDSLLSSAIFVDDSCNTFVPESEAHHAYLAFISFLKTRFTLKNDCDGMELITSFLGMNFVWAPDRSWVRIDQPHSINKMVEGSGVDVSRPHFTPLPPGTEIMRTDCPDPNTPEGEVEIQVMKSKPYRKRVGELLWISRVSRPDIAAAVARLATVAHNPSLKAWEHTTYLIQYMHHTRHLGIVYSDNKSTYPYAFADVAFSPHYGDDDDDYRSFEGYLVKMCGGPISWSARFQKLLALSSSEAEYYGLNSAAKAAVHLKKLCSELGIDSDEPFLIYEDNKAAIKMASNSADSKRTMHLDRRAHFIRQLVNDGTIQLGYCPTKLMEADALTKMMPRPGFEFLRDRMGLTYDHCPDLTPRMKDLVR
jgi:hypothetical protein